MDRDEVRTAEELGEVDDLDAELTRTVLRDERVVRDDPHVHGGGADRDLPADPAEADDAEGLLVHLDADELRPLPLAALDRGVRLRDVAREREHHGAGVLGGGEGVALGGVRDDDAPPRGGCGIDVVDAGTGPPDEPELRPCLDHPCRDLGSGTDEQGVVFTDDPDQRVLGEVGLYVDVDLVAQDLDPLLGQRIAHKHSIVHS